MGRKFKCLFPYFTFVEVGGVVLIENDTDITLEDKSLSFSPSQQQEIISIVKNSTSFEEISEPTLTQKDMRLFTLWYREDVLFPSEDQIPQAIEYWIQYQKPKTETFIPVLEPSELFIGSFLESKI